MIVILVAFLRHVGLLDRGRVNAQGAMKGTGSRVSATSMPVLKKKISLVKPLSYLRYCLCTHRKNGIFTDDIGAFIFI